jgi:ABC-type transport system substrate-binding protein
MGEKKRELTRRKFLGMSAAAAAAAVAASCGDSEPEVVKETIIQTVVEKETVVETVVEKETVVEEKIVEVTVEPAGTEPPFLADRVASGELPPVDERLPVSPAVVGGRDAIGEYGGDVRMIHLSPTGFTENYDLNSERMLHYSDVDLRTIVPNILESWEVSDDGKTYTLHLREGMKWSTGEPLTSEDIRFWWEDVQLNTDLNASPAWQFRLHRQVHLCHHVWQLPCPPDPLGGPLANHYTLLLLQAVPSGVHRSGRAGCDGRRRGAGRLGGVVQ